jgi:3',5'-cyclic AMP phosphodiesterase CpdA
LPTHTSFLHLSDLHLARPGEVIAGVDPWRQVRRALARIGQVAIEPAFAVISGDLSDDGSAESYALVKTLADDLSTGGMPVLLALGNHDDRATFRRVVLGEPSDDAAPYCYSRRIDGLRVIVLDTLIPGEEQGEVGAAQLAWLDDELRTPAPEGTLIVLHHCCRVAGPPRTIARFVLRDAAALEAAVARHAGEIRGVLAGHSHQTNSGQLGGVPYATAPAVLYGLDFFAGPELAPVPTSGFNLCQLQDGQLVVHPVYEGDG